jgi:DNA-nicking Smr family endonuclease
MGKTLRLLNKTMAPKTKPSDCSFTPFKGLKEVLEKSNVPVPCKAHPPLMKSKTDEEIFADAMAGVREIKEFRQMPVKQPPRVKFISRHKEDSCEDLRRVVQGKLKIRLSDTGEYIEWIRPHARKDIAQRLHRGDFSVQDYIDLHGMTLIEAKEALFLFFKESLRKQLFCIKVIHGRGLRSPDGPVLKEALKALLQGPFRKWTLAYSSAKSCDGGLGATYIILK